MTSTIRKPQKLDSDIPCECGFLLYEPIAEIGVSKLGLYNDARFPGRCILALDQEFSCANSRHIDSLDELSPDLAAKFVADIQLATKAIKKATSADRVNVAILGNREHHLHAHLIPRFRKLEKYPDNSPWNDPRKLEKFSAAQTKAVKSKIYDELSSADLA